MPRKTVPPPDLVREYERRVRSLTILRNLSEFIKVLDVKEGDILKSMLVKFSLEAIDADFGALHVFDPVTGALHYYAAYGSSADRRDTDDLTGLVAHLHHRRGEGLPGTCLESQESVVCADASRHPGYDGRADAVLPVRAGSVICLPITVEHEPVAVLEVTNAPGRRVLDEADLETLIIIANLSSAAMENAKLFLWAITDPLTRLYNIHYFRRTLASELKRAERYGLNFTLVMLDLDDLKRINDTWGHAVGDQVLSRIADVLQANLRREIDVPARYGGDEFILLLPNTPLAGALVVMGRVVQRIAAERFRPDDGEVAGQDADPRAAAGPDGTFGVTVSAGVACFPAHGGDSTTLAKRADLALYLAKKAGKNRVKVYEHPAH